MTLGAGTYVVTADVWLEDDSPSDATDLAECELILGSATDEVQLGLAGPNQTPLNDGTLAMTVAATIASSGPAVVSCVGAGNTGETFAETGSMTAIQTTSLSG